MALVIFLPGIMGSALVQNKTKKWPALMEKDFKDLSLEKTPQILDSLPLLKAFRLKIVYEDLFEFFEGEYRENFVSFWYDWRHGLWKEKIFKKLLKVIETHDPHKDLVFVAHSMGGLLLRMFVEWCEMEGHNSIIMRIKKIITIATPWRGAPDALWKLHYGEPFPFSMLPLTSAKTFREVASSFPSIYHLLPHDAHLKNSDLAFDPNSSKVLKSDEIFKTLLNNKQLQMYKNVNVKGLHRKLQNPWPSHIKTFAIIGFKKPTIKNIIMPIKDENKKILEKEILKMSGGDTTVPVTYAQPYDNRTECKFIEATHQGIVRKKEVLTYINSLIKEEAYNDVKNLYSNSPTEAFDGSVIKVACPVEVSVYKDNLFIGGEASNLDELRQQLDWLYNLEDVQESAELIEEVKVMGESTYILTNEQKNLDYKIEGKDKGIANIEVQKYEEGEMKNIFVFPALKVEDGSLSTLHVDTLDNVTLISNVEDEIIHPKEIDVQKDRMNIKPITNVSYELLHGEVIESENNMIIQSPIRFNISISNINEQEFLETRVIVNGEKISLNSLQYDYNPEPGINEIIIYSVSKYGKIDEKPFKFSFIYDCEPPSTTLEALLFQDKIQIFLNAIDDSGTEVETFYKFSDQQEWQVYEKSGIATDYNGQILEYYSVDRVGNKEHPINQFNLPFNFVRENIFNNQYKTYKQLLTGLNIIEDDIEELAKNNRLIKNYNGKIPKKANNISVKSTKGIKYLIVFNQGFDVLWTKHPEEILYANDTQLRSFKFRLVSKNEFIKGDNVKVKIISKGKSKRSLNDNISFNYLESSLEYEGYFGVPLIPRHIDEGSIHIIVNNKVYREAKFKVL